MLSRARASARVKELRECAGGAKNPLSAIAAAVAAVAAAADADADAIGVAALKPSCNSTRRALAVACVFKAVDYDASEMCERVERATFASLPCAAARRRRCLKGVYSRLPASWPTTKSAQRAHTKPITIIVDTRRFTSAANAAAAAATLHTCSRTEANFRL